MLSALSPFPPLMSLLSVQPVESTWQKQRALWLELIRSYAAHHRMTRLALHLYRPASSMADTHAASASSTAATAAATSAVAAASSSAAASASSTASKDGALLTALFRNSAIDRSLSVDAIRLLLDAVASEGWGVWEDGHAGATRSSFLISPAARLPEVADAIHSHVHSIGEGQGLLTLYELCHGDLMKSASFARMDEGLMMAALRILEAKGKVALMPAAVLSETGVKFLG